MRSRLRDDHCQAEPEGLMVWIIGAVSMILFGGTLVAIGLALGTFAWTIIGGITVVGGLFLLFSFRRSSSTR